MQKFIPKSVFEFMHIYSYHEAHPSSPFPSINNVSARYLFAEMYYKGKLSEYISSQRKT